jgi:outer membrane protein OmpA-like peptidoglycan-associated protein
VVVSNETSIVSAAVLATAKRQGHSDSHGRKEDQMQNALRMLCLVGMSVVLITGCATRNWVRDYVGVQAIETHDRVAKVDEKVDQKATEGMRRAEQIDARIADESKRVDGRIEGLGTRVNANETAIGEVRGRADAAQEQANNALRKQEATDSRLATLWANRDRRTRVDTIDVPFGFNRANLNDSAATALMALVKELKENEKLSVALVGYADPVGPREYNIQLSQRRVEAVRRFLVEHDVELWRIHTVGLGPVTEKGIPNQQKRRVTVTLLTSE